jgi:hypothetical protein
MQINPSLRQGGTLQISCVIAMVGMVLGKIRLHLETDWEIRLRLEADFFS